MSALPALLVAAVAALAVVACASLVGVPEVPEPVDSGGGSYGVYESGPAEGGVAPDGAGALDAAAPDGDGGGE